MYKNCIKRLLDFLLALLGIIILSPLLLVISAAVKLDSKGPILFKQKRIGLDKTTFMIYKFRTMRVDTPKEMPTHLLNQADSYITRVGGFLRKSSLDELPQLFNILKGEMALIGPRPALWNQDDLIAERDLYGANKVRPGLTGLAQISGRDELPIDKKAALDGKYVSAITFSKDCKYFLGTIVSITKEDGIVEGGTGAMKEKEKK